MAVEPGVPFLSMREVVMEIRSDVKDLAKKLERIDREGSIGTKQELDDHERRLRDLERTGWRSSGSWATVSLLFVSLMSLAGLTLGVLGRLG